MSLARLYRVFRLDFLTCFRRPLFWILILIVVFTCWGLSTGVMQISSGDSHVGGTKAWITSEFALAQMLIITVFLFYGFFIAVAAGMPIIRDDELKIVDLLHSSSLGVGEYIWGKFGAVLLAFLGVLGVNLLLMMFFNHLVPNERSLDMRGPFALSNYLVPALVFTVPTIVFLAGVSFAVGEWTRRPILLFILPVAELLICAFFLWDWSPSWLPHWINRALMLIDPSAFRWLSETWLKGDRGVRFYNTQPIPLNDQGLIVSRLCFLGIGLGAVVLSQLHLQRSLRGAAQPRRSLLDALRRRAPAAPQLFPVAAAPAPAAPLAMRSGVPGFWRSVWLIARTELRELRTQPGLYLFVPLILLETIGTAFFLEGAFGTPLLQTPGTMAVSTMSVLTLLVTLLLMFYTVESLRREQGTGLASIHYATPIRTSALLFGKALANSFVGVVIVLATLVACVIVILIQGKVPVTLWQFALVWGLLLFPTFLLWTSFVTASFSLTNNREATYGISLGALIVTIWMQRIGWMNWVGNWPLLNTLHWTDMGVLEFDRTALILNRVMVLGLAVCFTAMSVSWFRRREIDPGRVWTRLYPKALFKYALRLTPYVLVPLISGIMLYGQVNRGFEGASARKDRKDYWRKNLATWKDSPIPALASVDLNLTLDPRQSSFHSEGTYEIENQRSTPLRQIPLTAGDHWSNISWTMNGQDYTPKNNSLLYVFTPPKELAPKEKVRIGFSFDGRFPRGISKNGTGVMEFILPSGVVLTSFTPSIAPVIGYLEQVGVDKDNRYEAKEYPDDFYKGLTDPAFGTARGFPTHLRITAPEEYTINSVGVLEKEQVADGKRTVEWRSDHPVRFFNVVAGKWAKEPGHDTAVYYHPGHSYNLDEMSEALDAARKYYSEWFCPYPWKELKLSEFPNLSGYAQGFPTDITFSEGIGFLTRSDAVSELAFMVTAHESAHQWWGNILTPGKGPGGDILSEGMAHFSTALLFEQVKGPRGRIEFLKNIEHRYEISRRVDSERPLVKIDGSADGDTTVTYDKGGWVFWMLLRQMGRKQALEGLQEFIREYKNGPDYPLLQDFVEVMRRFAPDKAAYDAFVKQWFFEVVVPEYHLTDAERNEVAGKDEWDVSVHVENGGTGEMKVDVAAATGERFDSDGKPNAAYKDARTSVELGASEAKDVKIHCPFKPDRVLMDPDALVLQIRRKLAVAQF